MVNPIKNISPYRLKGIKYINDYLYVLNRLSRLIEENKFRIDPEGILILVRWSNKKNCWVGDKCTSLYRDKSGISLNDLNLYNELNNDYKFCLKIILELLNKKYSEMKIYNLNKNENKTLAFKVRIIDCITKNISIKSLGLYSIIRSKPCNIIDVSNETIINISRILDIDYDHIMFSLKVERNLFEKFTKSIKSKFLNLNIDNEKKNFYVKNMISSKQKIFENKISLENKKYDNFNSKLLDDIIFNNKNIDNYLFESISSNITIYYLNILYYEFVKSTMFLDDSNIVINIYDKLNKKLYKLSNHNYINNNLTNPNLINENKKEINLDYNLMLPGLI